MPRHRLDIVAFVALGAIWGTNFLFMKQAVQVISPLQVVWLRVVFGSVPILVFAFWRGVLGASDWRRAPLFLGTSVLSTVVPYLGFVKGTQLLKSGAAGAISGIVPLLTAAMAAWLLPSERLGYKKALGLALGLVGVLCIVDVTRLRDSTSQAPLLGLLFMLAGSSGYAAGMVYVRRFISPLGFSPLALAAYQTAGAAALLTAVTPRQGTAALLQTPAALAALALGLGLLGTGVAFILYYRLIESMGAVGASSVFYLPPAVALVVAAAFGHETIAPSQCLGTSLIVVGIFLTRQPALAPALRPAATPAEAR